MRYYKPKKEEIVKGLICEMYDDETYDWTEIIVTNPRAIRAIWHKDDIRVRYLCEEDFNDLGLAIKFHHQGKLTVIVGFDEKGEDIEEEQDVFSDNIADIIEDGKKVGQCEFYVNTDEETGELLENISFKGRRSLVRNKFELIKLIENG